MPLGTLGEYPLATIQDTSITRLSGPEQAFYSHLTIYNYAGLAVSAPGQDALTAYMSDTYGDAPGPGPALDISPCQDVSMKYVFGASQAAQNAVRDTIKVPYPTLLRTGLCPLPRSHSEV
jgi:hypothetical protein